MKVDVDFIRQHLNSDVNHLLLNPPVGHRQDIKFLAGQILARQKAKDKLPHWYQNFDLIFPPPLSVEQSSSFLTANYKASLIKGKSIADLTGGMGIDTLSFCDSFESVTYVESNSELCEVFEHNIRKLNKSVTIVNDLAENFLRTTKEHFSAIYLDPARRDMHAKKVFQLSDCEPDVTRLLELLLSKSDQVLIKTSPMLDIKKGFMDLHGKADEIHVVSLKNECKELLFLIRSNSQVETPKIQTVDIQGDFTYQFEFNWNDEENAKAEFGPALRYLLLPNASILKAGAFNLLSDVFGIHKISKSTHLYTSEDEVKNFPGRQFEIIRQEVKSKDLEQLLPDRKVNVITRNYPLTPDQLKQKFKLRDGGEYFLIGFRNHLNKPQVVLARKI